MVAFTHSKRDELFPFSYTVKTNIFFHLWTPLIGKALGLWYQGNPPVVVWFTGYENLALNEVTSGSGQHECLPYRKKVQSQKTCSLYQNTHHLCAPPARLFWEVIWAGYCVLMGSSCIIFARAGSNCSAPRRNEHPSPTLVSSTNLSAQQACLWKHGYDAATQHLKHPVQPTINCHFRHLWQTVNTCLSGNCTLQAQPMEQYFLSNQWLIRELNKNKGYTIRSPPFHLCSIKMYNSN